MKTWQEIINDPRYQAYSPQQKAAFAERFFQEKIMSDPKYISMDEDKRGRFRDRFYKEFVAPGGREFVGESAPAASTSVAPPQLQDMAKIASLYPAGGEVSPVSPSFWEEVKYGAARIGSQLERGSAAAGELLAGLAQTPAMMIEDVLQTTDRPLTSRLEAAEKYYAHPEKHGMITPHVEKKTQQYREAAYRKGTGHGIVFDIETGIIDVGTLIAQMMAMGALGQGAPKPLQANVHPLKPVFNRMAKVGAHGFVTTQGDLGQRLQAATIRIGYNITPYIVQSMGVSGIIAPRAVDTLLNTFLTSPSYLKAWKQAGGLNEEFLSMVIPQFLMDFGMALSTKGDVAKTFDTKFNKYWAKRFENMQLPRNEARQLVLDMREIVAKEGIEVDKKSIAEQTEDMHRHTQLKMPEQTPTESGVSTKQQTMKTKPRAVMDFIDRNATETQQTFRVYRGRGTGKSKAFAGLWTTVDERRAAKFGPKVEEYELTLRNPKVIESGAQARIWDQSRVSAQDIEKYKQQGYDGVVIKRGDKVQDILAFDESQLTRHQITAKQPQTVAAVSKQPWQMTRSEYREKTIGPRQYSGPNQLTVEYSNKETKADIEHRQSIVRAIDRGEKVSAEVLKDYPDIQKTMKTKPQTVMDFIDRNADEVSASLGEKKQAGKMILPKPEKMGKEPPSVENRRIQRILNVSRTPHTVIQQFKTSAQELKGKIKDAFVFRHRVIKEHPVYANEVRKFLDAPLDARTESEKAIYGIIGDLDSGKRLARKTEYPLFRKIVALEDLRETAEQGLKVPQGVTVAEITEALKTLRENAPPKVLSAVEKHFELMRAVSDDLVNRGKMSAEETREHYYPHRVLDYEPNWGSWIGLPRRLKKSYRPYTKARVGSVRDIDMDYIGVMQAHLTKVFLDNKLDDFLAREMRTNDVMPKLSDKQKTALFGESKRPITNRLYEIDGKEYKAIQAEPGNALYPASTINESLFNQAVEANMTVAEFAQMTGPRGGAAVGKGAALGRPHKVYVLPRAIAEDMLRFKTPAGDMGWLYSVTAATSIWKRLTLDFAGLAFQYNNFIGDGLNLYRNDPKAFTNLGKALKLIATPESKWSPEEKQLMRLAREQRVDTTYFLREAGVVPGRSVLEKFQHPLVRYNPLNLWMRFWETISTGRERSLRLAKFITDTNRIVQGKPVKSKAINVKGLDAINAAGKTAREFTVDYNAITPQYRTFLRGFLTPFITFYDYNARNWYRYAAQKPGEAFAKVGVPYAAMWVWNNTGNRKEVEENLPDYYRFLPHIIPSADWKTKDGKTFVIAFQTPVDMAGKWFGLDRIPDKITKIRAGDITAEEAAKQQLVDIGLGAPRTVGALLNPAIQVMRGLATNKHPFFNSPIVPERFKGTDEGKKLQAEFVVSSLLAPYGQYMKASRMLEPGDTFSKWLVGGPFDVQRALGIREVDLESGKMARTYKAEEKYEKQSAQVLADLEKSFIHWQSTGDDKRWKRAVEKLQKGTIKPTGEQFFSRIFSWRTFEQIFREKLRRLPKGDPREAEYKEILDYIRKNRWLLHAQKVPKAVREEFYKDVGRIMAPTQ